MLSIGVDIGGTKVAAGVVDEDGEILRHLVRPTPSRSPEAVENAIVEVVDSLSDGLPVKSAGIGAAGWVDTEQALVRFSPHLAWRNEPLRDRLSERIDLPVIVDNDANAAAWAEYEFGAGRDSRVMTCITLGTGIGGALVINGRVFRGRYGMAGEFGHMTVVPDGHWCPCGNRGCWEQYASGNSLVRDAKALLAEHVTTLGDGWRLVRREWMTPIGPVDLLCRNAEGVYVAVEIKRRGEIDGVEQLTRYLELLNRDPALTRKGAVRGIFAAQAIKPQAKVLAGDRGIDCVTVDYDALRGMDNAEDRLF